VLAFLESRARTLGSSSLAQAAAALRLQDSEDHFAHVRGIIRDLIARLKDQAEKEATAKSVCDEGMEEAVSERDEKASDLESVVASIAVKNSQIAQLKKDIAQLAKDIAASNKALNEMTELRQEDNAMNEKVIMDATDGATAVQEASALLRAYYTTILQTTAKGSYSPPNADSSGNTVADLAPETFSEEVYAGKGAESASILGLFDVIEDDFDRTAKDTTDREKDEQDAFDDAAKSMNKEISGYEEEKRLAEQEKTAAEDALLEFEDQKNDAVKVLDGALASLEALKPQCVEGETYAERVAKREKEIEGLKEALKMLQEWQA